MATASTMMPSPPIHCNCWRYQRIEIGMWSRPVKTVAPVVVMPETVSNTALAAPESSTSRKGRDPARETAAQQANTTRKPSATRRSRWLLRIGRYSALPTTATTTRLARKAPAAPSWLNQANASGGRKLKLRNISSIPTTRWTGA